MSYVDEPELNPYAAPASKIAESPGLDASQYVGYAGFWRRFCALFVDNLLIGIVEVMIFFVAGIAMGMTGNQDNPTPFMIVAYLLIFILVMGYFPGMESSSYQATLGKMAMGIKVTDLYGRRISFGKACGRFFGKILSAIILYIGFIMAGFTEKKQALHDIIAGTLVLKAR